MKFQSSDRSGYQKEPYSLKSKIFTLCAQHSTADYPRFVVECALAFARSYCRTTVRQNASAIEIFDHFNQSQNSRLKSVHFKKTVARISILSELWYWYFQYKLKQKIPQF